MPCLTPKICLIKCSATLSPKQQLIFTSVILLPSKLEKGFILGQEVYWSWHAMTLIVRKVWQVVCLDSGGWCYLAELGQKPEQRRTHPDNRSGDSEHPSSTPHNVWWLSFIDNLPHLVILSALDCKNGGKGKGWGYLPPTSKCRHYCQLNCIYCAQPGEMRQWDTPAKW